MSGLWVRPHMGAGQDGFRGECSKQPDDLLKAIGINGMSHALDRLITPSAIPASSGTRSARQRQYVLAVTD
jgi:hypothetical protein